MLDVLAAHAAHTTTVLAGTGFLDTANSKAAALQVTLRLGAGVASIWFVIKNWIASGGALARLVVVGFAAALFMWIVFNVTTDLQPRIDNEIKTASSEVTAPHPATPQTVALQRFLAVPVVPAAG